MKKSILLLHLILIGFSLFFYQESKAKEIPVFPFANINVTAPSITLCIGGGYQTLGNIVLSETANNDFKKDVSGAQDLILTMPSNYELNPGVGNINVLGAGFSNVSITVTNNQITISFNADIASESSANTMVIGGLQVRAVTGATNNQKLKRDVSSTDLTSFAGSPDFAVFNSNAQPSSPTAPATTNFCQGQNIASNTVTATGGINYKWYNNPFSIGVPLATTATVNVSTLGVNTTNPGSYTVYVTQTSASGCESTPRSVTFNVNPTPTAFLTSNLGQGTIIFCSGSNITFTAFPAGLTSYNFKKNGSSVQNNSSNVYSANNLVNGDVITVEITSGTCTSPPSTGITADVRSVVVSFVAPSQTTYTTATTSVDLLDFASGSPSYGGKVNGAFVNASTGTYSGPGVSGTRFYPSIATVGGPYNIVYSYTSPEGCTGQATIQFNVVSESTPIQNLNASYCVGAVATNLKPSSTILAFDANASIQATPGLTQTGTNPNTYSFNTASFGGQNVTLAVNATLVLGGLGSFPITYYQSFYVRSLPTLDFYENGGGNFKTAYCKNQANLLLKGNVDGFSSFTGTELFEIRLSPAGAYSTLAGNTINFASLTAGSTYDIRYTYSYPNSPNCSNSILKSFVVYAVPSPSATGPNNVCNNSTVSYSTASTGNFYYWNLSGGGNVISAFSSNPSINWNTPGGPYTLTVTETNLATGCNNTSTISNINVNVLPNPSISGNNSVCSGSTGEIYSVPLVSGNTYSWSVPGGTITAGQGTRQITVTWGTGTTGIVSLLQTVTATGCANTVNLGVTINPLPLSSISGNSSVCANSTGNTYSVAFTSGHTYSWNITGGTITSGQNTNIITVDWGTGPTGTLSLTENIVASSCSKTSNLAVTINPLPTPSITGLNAVCAGQTGVTYTTANNVGSTYSWFVTGGTITSSSNTNTITVDWGSGATGTVSVIETFTATSCGKTVALPVTINPLPTPFIGNNSAQCEYTTGVVYNTSFVAGHSYAWTVSGGTITSGAGTNQITVDWGVAGVGSVSVLQTNTTTGCSQATSNSITLNPLPNPTISGNLNVCKLDVQTYSAPILAGHTYSWSITGGIITSATNLNSITVNWNASGTGVLTLVETNTLTTPSCSKTTTVNVTINPTPDDLLFSALNTCFGDVTQFNATATGITGAWTWSWNFGDGTVSSLQNPTKTYSSVGNYLVTLKANNQFGCSYTTTQTITINPVPVAQFNVFGSCNGVQTQFTDLSTVSNPGVIDNWSWDFGDGVVLSGSNPLVHKNPKHSYASVGIYTVKLTVKAGNCQDVISKKIAIFPSITVTPSNPYQQSFNSGNGGWLDGGANSSWALGTVNKTNIKNSTGNAWVTNLSGTYNDTERSYVESPCFDISQLDKPMVSMKIWTDTDESSDGAVLLISDNDGLTWQVLGSLNQGIEWYNKSGILGNPGLQGPAQASWTGSIVGWAGNTQTNWVTAKYSLDAFKGKTVRFRVSFGSNADNPVGKTFDGFAFDDFFIENRNRVVLIEHFTNAMASTASSENSYLYNFNTTTGTEAVFIEHHTNFPGDDQLNKDNTADPSARALLYGVSQTTRASIDGYIENKLFSAYGNNYYSKRTLETSPFKIDITFPTTPTTSVDIKVGITALSAVNNPVVVQIAVIEKQVTANGVAYRNVLKKLLPDATGNLLTNTWTKGTQRTISQTWTVQNVYDLNQLAVIAYIQDDKTKEIYQSAIVSLPSAPTGNSPAIVTGIADEGLDQGLMVYPNPASDEVTVDLMQTLQYDCIVNTYSQTGQLVLTNTVKAGENKFTINTSSLAEGVYILEFIYKNSKNTVKKSLVIKHR